VGHQHGLDQQRLEVFQRAIELLTDRELLRNPSRHNPRRHRDAVRRGKSRDHATRAHAWLLEHPDGTAEQLADHLEPPDPAPAATPAGHRPATGHQGSTGKPDPTPVHLPPTIDERRQSWGEVEVETSGRGPVAAREALQKARARRPDAATRLANADTATGEPDGNYGPGEQTTDRRITEDVATWGLKATKGKSTLTGRRPSRLTSGRHR